MMKKSGDCSKCRKKSYCKKQCRANREYLEKQVRLHIAQYLAKKLLTKKEIRNDD